MNRDDSAREMLGIARSAETNDEREPESGVEPARGLRSLRAARRRAIDRFEVEYVRELLQLAEGNVTRAAAIAEVSRQVIHKLISKHQLDRQAAVDARG